MVKFFLFIKRELIVVWNFLEDINGFIFNKFYANDFNKTIDTLLSKPQVNSYTYHKIEQNHLQGLSRFFERQDAESFKFFNPHSFDLQTLERLLKNPSFIMMGVSEGNKIIGYFFLRCFFNKKCFIGRIVDKDYQKRGIAKGMNEIMYETAWQNGFKCLTTISKHNKAIVQLHQKEKDTVILKELANDYYLVEMKKSALKSSTV